MTRLAFPVCRWLAASAAFCVATAAASAQDFDLLVTPPLAVGCPNIEEGDPAVFDVSVQSIQGFSSPVTLSVSGLPFGAFDVFSVNPVSPPGSSVLTVDAGGVAAGTTSIQVTGTSGALMRSKTVQLEVPPLCTFTIAAQAPLQCDRFQVQYTLLLAPAPIFVVPVILSVGSGLPAQASTSFDVNPVSVPGSSVLSVSNLGSAAPGTYPFDVVGTYLFSESTSLELVIPLDWQNELGSPAECDACQLLTSSATQANTGVASTPLFAQLFESGVTEAPGASGSVTAELGYGPLGSDPRTDCSWRWLPASYSGQVGNADQYTGTVQIGANGTYAATFRFSLDGGNTASAADLDGAGSQMGLVFDPAGLATVAVPEPAAARAGAVLLATLLALRASRAPRSRGRSRNLTARSRP